MVKRQLRSMRSPQRFNQIQAHRHHLFHPIPRRIQSVRQQIKTYLVGVGRSVVAE
jgi:hypothetical protein